MSFLKFIHIASWEILEDFIIVEAPIVKKYIDTLLLADGRGMGKCEKLPKNEYFKITSTIIHEDFDKNSKINDIALITVDRDFDVKLVHPIKLASKKENGKHYSKNKIGSVSKNYFRPHF